jgi:hypothetical protein
MTQIIIDIGPIKRSLTERNEAIGEGRLAVFDASARAESEQQDFARRTVEADKLLTTLVSKIEAELGVDISSNLARLPHKWAKEPVPDGDGHQVLTYKILNSVPEPDRVRADGFFADEITIANGVIRFTGAEKYRVSSGGGIESVPCGYTFEAFEGAAVPKTGRYASQQPLTDPKVASHFADLLVRSTVSVPSGVGAGARITHAIAVPLQAHHRA